jgi:hypothetical protein
MQSNRHIKKATILAAIDALAALEKKDAQVPKSQKRELNEVIENLRKFVAEPKTVLNETQASLEGKEISMHLIWEDACTDESQRKAKEEKKLSEENKLTSGFRKDREKVWRERKKLYDVLASEEKNNSRQYTNFYNTVEAVTAKLTEQWPRNNEYKKKETSEEYTACCEAAYCENEATAITFIRGCLYCTDCLQTQFNVRGTEPGIESSLNNRQKEYYSLIHQISFNVNPPQAVHLFDQGNLEVNSGRLRDKAWELGLKIGLVIAISVVIYHFLLIIFLTGTTVVTSLFPSTLLHLIPIANIISQPFSAADHASFWIGSHLGLITSTTWHGLASPFLLGIGVGFVPLLTVILGYAVGTIAENVLSCLERLSSIIRPQNQVQAEPQPEPAPQPAPEIIPPKPKTVELSAAIEKIAAKLSQENPDEYQSTTSRLLSPSSDLSADQKSIETPEPPRSSPRMPSPTATKVKHSEGSNPPSSPRMFSSSADASNVPKPPLSPRSEAKNAQNESWLRKAEEQAVKDKQNLKPFKKQ